MASSRLLEMQLAKNLLMKSNKDQCRASSRRHRRAYSLSPADLASPRSTIAANQPWKHSTRPMTPGGQVAIADECPEDQPAQRGAARKPS
jgi:hypothetical protein